MSDSDPRDTIWNHMRAIGTCMLTTHDGEQIGARPMRSIPRQEQNAIWFITDADAEREAAMARHPAACLGFADLKGQNFVSVSGTIGRVEDPAQLAALWSEGASVYFPQGPDDPSVALLKFSPLKGEYWDAPSNPIVLAIKFLQAKVTAERPDLGVHEAAHLG